MKYHILNDIFKMLYYNKIVTKYNQEKNQERDEIRWWELLFLESLRTCAAIKYQFQLCEYNLCENWMNIFYC